jgi:hypothetical protein
MEEILDNNHFAETADDIAQMMEMHFPDDQENLVEERDREDDNMQNEREYEAVEHISKVEECPECWRLPLSWWIGKPKLNKPPIGHLWCRPLYGSTRPTKEVRIFRRIAGRDYKQMHNDSGRCVGTWVPEKPVKTNSITGALRIMALERGQLLGGPGNEKRGGHRRARAFNMTIGEANNGVRAESWTVHGDEVRHSPGGADDGM